MLIFLSKELGGFQNMLSKEVWRLSTFDVRHLCSVHDSVVMTYCSVAFSKVEIEENQPVIEIATRHTS